MGSTITSKTQPAVAVPGFAFFAFQHSDERALRVGPPGAMNQFMAFFADDLLERSVDHDGEGPVRLHHGLVGSQQRDAVADGVTGNGPFSCRLFDLFLGPFAFADVADVAADADAVVGQCYWKFAGFENTVVDRFLADGIKGRPAPAGRIAALGGSALPISSAVAFANDFFFLFSVEAAKARLASRWRKRSSLRKAMSVPESMKLWYKSSWECSDASAVIFSVCRRGFPGPAAPPRPGGPGGP